MHLSAIHTVYSKSHNLTMYGLIHDATYILENSAMFIRENTFELMKQKHMAKSVHWYGYVLRGALNFEVEGQRKKGRSKRTWKKQDEGEGGFEKGRCTLQINERCWRQSDFCEVAVNPASLVCWGCCLV